MLTAPAPFPSPARQDGHPAPAGVSPPKGGVWPWTGTRQCQAAAGEASSPCLRAESSPRPCLWLGTGPRRAVCSRRVRGGAVLSGGGEQRAWCSARLCWAAELFESPLLESEEEHLLLDPGNVLKLYCDTNHSGASVVWYKESRPLVPGGRVHLQQSLLEISEVAYEDSGLYVCRARGTGEILRNFTISVVGEHPGRCRGSMPLHTGASLTTRFPPQTRWRRAMTMKTAMGTAPTESAARSPSTCTEVSAAPGRAVALCRWPRPTARHVCPQRRTGPTRTGWTRSCTPSPRGTPSSFAARPRAAPAPASAGSRTGASSGASTASGASG